MKKSPMFEVETIWNVGNLFRINVTDHPLSK